MAYFFELAVTSFVASILVAPFVLVPLVLIMDAIDCRRHAREVEALSVESVA